MVNGSWLMAQGSRLDGQCLKMLESHGVCVGGGAPKLNLFKSSISIVLNRNEKTGWWNLGKSGIIVDDLRT